MEPRIVTEVDNIFILIVSISVFFLLLITVAMIYFVIRYRKKKHPVAENITGNTTLEIVWTVIPLILVMLIFYYGWVGFKTMRNVPPDAMTVKVTGKMWLWSFEYENTKKSDSLLYVPVGRPIKMEINSADVIHSFYLAAFRIKEDAIPGRTNYLWFHPLNLGEYDIVCAEYCGMNHSYMLGKLIVLPEDKFKEWVSQLPPPPDTLKADSLKIGVKLD
ncbi:MAG: cytochrome c oxidase subunit II, partial [Ignavibacteria bacterium]